MRDRVRAVTPRYNVARGTGQGCVNGATRAKLALALTQRVVERACKGYGFVLDPTRHICQGWFADYACLHSCSPHELLKMMECCWVVAQMMGLQVNVKGKKKTAWSGTYWTKDKRGRMVETDIECGEWKMRLPNGVEVPQIKMGQDQDVDYYKHLGSELGPGFTGGQDRVTKGEGGGEVRRGNRSHRGTEGPGGNGRERCDRVGYRRNSGLLRESVRAHLGGHE